MNYPPLRNYPFPPRHHIPLSELLGERQAADLKQSEKKKLFRELRQVNKERWEERNEA